nr:MAG TPA: hypothetical protein [Caudoviricetes sp.]
MCRNNGRCIFSVRLLYGAHFFICASITTMEAIRYG